MKTIKAQKLTKENFSKYGSFENLYQPETMGVGIGSPSAFYPDVMPLDLGTAHNASVCVCHVRKRQMSSNLCEKTIKYFTRQGRRPRRTRSRRSDSLKSREDNY